MYLNKNGYNFLQHLQKKSNIFNLSILVIFLIINFVKELINFFLKS